jgi:hypothetical protein
MRVRSMRAVILPRRRKKSPGRDGTHRCIWRCAATVFILARMLQKRKPVLSLSVASI